MEVASGEHGQAIYKLVNAVNSGKCINYKNSKECLVSVVPNSNIKIISSLVPNRPSSDTMELKQWNQNGIEIHDSVIVNIDLLKSSKLKPQSSKVQQYAPKSHSNLIETIESDDNLAVDSCHINGFPTSTTTQFWILLKRTFLTTIRDQTLTQMRLVSHVVVGAIIGAIYYGIGNDAHKIMSNAGCLFFTTLFTMFTG